MKPLWAPWRMEYVKAPKEDENIFNDKVNSKNDRDNLILYRGDFSFIIMNLYPYNNGHILILPYKKISNMEDLNDNELLEIMKLAQEAMLIFKRKMNAEGFNFGLNMGRAAGAGIKEHLHYHLVPRWSGDNNFMPTIGNTKVIVQGLLETYDLIFPEFKKINL
jgi:ATP adenylyltransferase